MTDAADRLRALEAAREAAAMGAGPEAIARQHARGKQTARERVDQLLDPGSFLELDRFRVHRSHDFGLAGKKIPGDGVVTGSGRIGGRPVYVFAHDFTAFGGSLGEVYAEKICKVQDAAYRDGVPCIGLYDSGGARIQEGVEALSGYVDVCFRNVRNSGVIPQITAIMGPCAGGAVYSTSLSDFTIMVRDTSFMYVTGPDVVKTVLHEDATHEELGGADVHADVTGVATLVVDDDDAAIAAIKRLLAYLPSNNLADAPEAKSADPAGRREEGLLGIVPDRPNQALDMAALVEMIVDDGDYLALQPTYAPNLLTALARLDGRPVGIVANDARHLAGTLDIAASLKASRFVRFCDAFNLPIVTFVDTPGYFPGKAQEYGGIIRHGAKLAYAYCEATVPKLTVVVRKAYGGAYGSMGAKNTQVDVVVAWPTAEIAVLGAESAASVLYRRELAEAPERREELLQAYRDRFATPWQAAEHGFVDDVIDPRETRPYLIRALATLRRKRVETPPRKHSSMPL
jgi:propionyl-CoA carboxylase beta chain